MGQGVQGIVGDGDNAALRARTPAVGHCRSLNSTDRRINGHAGNERQHRDQQAEFETDHVVGVSLDVLCYGKVTSRIIGDRGTRRQG